MKKLILIICMTLSLSAGACSSRPSRASELYNGCIFTVKNGEITTYGVFVEVKDRVTDYSVMNLRTYDENIAPELGSYEADESKIYYRTETVYNACHAEGYGAKSYFIAATRPLYKLPEDKYRKLVSKLASATIQVSLSEGKSGQTYTFSTVLPVIEEDETPQQE